jgi:acyl-CoA synthetase
MRAFLTLHSPVNARAWYAQGLWQADTCYDLLARNAEARPGVEAARDGRRTVTWGEMRRWADAIAAEFSARGLVAGDRVSLWMPNRLEAVAVFLACARAGFACNPSLHRTHTCADIGVLLGRLSSRVLVTTPEWGADRSRADFAAVLSGVSSLAKVYAADDLPPPLAVPSAEAACNDPDGVRYLAFTSGTTGTPKCVMHSDNTLLANARDMARDWRCGPHTRLVSLSPVSHHIAWVAVAQWLLTGCTLILDDPPPGLSRLDWLIESGATYAMGVPTHAMDLLAEQERRGMARLGAVETFYMAGAAIPPTVAAAFVQQGIKPQNVYGMTENSSHQYTHPADDTATIVETCGRGGPAYEIRIFDPADRDRELPPDAVGEIGGRGAALMLGYFGNQDATEASFNRDGWFMSGDLGALDAHGNLRVQGRLKDLIIRGGHNIYPSDIEALALRHPQVEKAAVFPVADARLGECICIAIIGAIAPDVLLAHLDAEGLSKFDRPEYFLRVETFPLTASGKILKRELIGQVHSGALAPTPIAASAQAVA